MTVRAETGWRSGRALRAIVDSLADAVSFLTILPVPGQARRDGFHLTFAVPWFPLVGALVGGVAGGVRIAFDPLLGRGPSTVIAIFGLVALTGALHQDALADMADGLGVRGDRQRRLEAMRDPRVGTFGVLALALWALLLFSSLVHLDARHSILTLIAAAAAGRMAAPIQAMLAPPARSDGLGARLRVNGRATLWACLLSAVIVITALGPVRGSISLGASTAAAVLTALVARRMLGGATGDTLGAAIALGELGVCVLLAGMWR